MLRSIILLSMVVIGERRDYFLIIDKCYDFPTINKYSKNRSHLVFQNFKKRFLYKVEFRCWETQIKKQNWNSSKNEACSSWPKSSKRLKNATLKNPHPGLGGQIEKFQTKSYFILNMPTEKKYNTMKFGHRDPERSIRYRAHLLLSEADLDHSAGVSIK